MTKRIGVIGFGNRIRNICTQISALCQDVALCAVADPRHAELRQQSDTPGQPPVVFYPDADTMLAEQSLDGVLIGTRCNLHVEMALKVMARNLPMFLEKPVAIDRDGLSALRAAARSYTAPCLTSFPLRAHPIVQRARELIDRGEIGAVQQIVAVNHIPYGRIYFRDWYRNHAETGGLFLQKATHDLDYLTFLAGAHPTRVAAMFSRGRVFGGDMPPGITCSRCEKQEECPESPWWEYCMKGGVTPPKEAEDRLCCFGREIGTPDTGMNEEFSSCQIEFANGVQASYTQNCFVSEGSGRRGASVIGYDGTIEFDWYRNELTLYKHHLKEEHTIKFTAIGSPSSVHLANRTLAFNFIQILRGSHPPICSLSDGIESAELCLTCKESAEQGCFMPIPTAPSPG